MYKDGEFKLCLLEGINFIKGVRVEEKFKISSEGANFRKIVKQDNSIDRTDFGHFVGG